MIDSSIHINLLLGLIAVSYILYSWNGKETDEWRKPLILILGILMLLFGFFYIIYDIYTDQSKTDSKFFYTAVVSVGVGAFTVYTAYSKRKDDIKNAWRFPLIYLGGIILIMFGFFMLGVMFFNIRLASIFVGVIGIIEILISLKISRKKSSVKWLFPLTLIGGLITFVFGIITYFLFTSSII